MNKLNTGRGEPREAILQAAHKVTITPSDSLDLKTTAGEKKIMFLYLPAELAVSFTLEGDTDSTAPEAITLTAGYHPLCVKKVWATGTADGTIIGYY